TDRAQVPAVTVRSPGSDVLGRMTYAGDRSWVERPTRPPEGTGRTRSPTMNLSERLDAARRQRQHGLAPDLQEEGYVLRSAVEGQRYDGTDVRSGEAMDPDRWATVRAERAGMALPSLSEP